MLDIPISLTIDKLEQLKSSLRDFLPEVKSSHRCEALGRGLGFRTFASAIAALKSDVSLMTSVFPLAFVNYLSMHGIQVDAKPLYRAIARLCLKDQAVEHPILTAFGFGSGQPQRKSGGLPETDTDRFGEFKKELTSDFAIEPFLLSLGLIQRVVETKTVRSGAGSYRLKHIAENYSFELNGWGKVGPTYVPNGVFVAAALFAGFKHKIFRDDRGYWHPNAAFNMSEKSVDDLDCEVRPDGAVAQSRNRRLYGQSYRRNAA